MKRHLLTVLAYIAATFVTQALSHFVVASGHYATIPYIRKEPIFQFGFLAMLVQGIILSALFAKVSHGGASTLKGAFVFSWLMGAFLVSYIAFAEVAKYAVPAITSWVAIELASGLVQFSIFGGLLGVIYRRAR